MKKKLLLSSTPFLFLSAATAVAFSLLLSGPARITSLALLAMGTLFALLAQRRLILRAFEPLSAVKTVLDNARRLGIPVSRTAEDQVDELLKDIQNALDHVLKANADLEWKVRQRREELEVSESQLRRTNAFLDSIVENIPDMIFVKDAKELRFVLFNKAGEELLGYSRKELIGKNDYDFFPKSEADFFTAKDRQVLNRGKIATVEEEPIHTKNGLRILHTKKIPLLDADGVPRFLLGISEDITARKQNEARLNERTLQLEAAKGEKDQMELFAYVAAHDLREPAHKISSFGDLLSEHLPPDGPARDYLSRMQSASERMGRLIDDLLKFSKVTRQEVKAETFSLEEVINEVVQDFELLINTTSARIDVGPLPVIETGRVQAQESFRNLIGNAIKFRKRDEAPVVSIHAAASNDGGVDVTVRDNGIGFEPAYTDRIFKPFERLHSRKEYDGSGIGLAICQKLAEQMGARITAESVPGKGSSFVISLPASIIRSQTAGAVTSERRA